MPWRETNTPLLAFKFPAVLDRVFTNKRPATIRLCTMILPPGHGF